MSLSHNLWAIKLNNDIKVSFGIIDILEENVKIETEKYYIVGVAISLVALYYGS